MNNNPTLAHSSFTPPPPPPPLRVSASTSSLDVNSQQLPLFATPAVNAKPSMARRLFKGWRLIVFRSCPSSVISQCTIAYTRLSRAESTRTPGSNRGKPSSYLVATADGVAQFILEETMEDSGAWVFSCLYLPSIRAHHPDQYHSLITRSYSFDPTS